MIICTSPVEDLTTQGHTQTHTAILPSCKLLRDDFLLDIASVRIHLLSFYLLCEGRPAQDDLKQVGQ